MAKTTFLYAIILCSVLAPAVWGDGGVTFENIAEGGGAGIEYERVPSARFSLVEDIIAQSPIPIPTFFFDLRPNASPQKGRGAPGVVLFDFDRDGDLDIYATNGPGAANSLYSSQLVETGSLEFVDVGAAAGVGADDQDSSGVCFGDIDNDGDDDLYVLGTGEANRLFENQGNGTFTDITNAAGVGGDGRHAVACSFADFDGDGYLDVVVGNSYDDWNHRIPVFATGVNYGGFEHNYLFSNNGDGTFTDNSAASGIENVSGVSGPDLSGAAFTWALATADYDEDGDVDILFADNQGSATIDAGLLRLYDNDGSGNFTEVTAAAGLNIRGGWMGIDFGDFNCDSNLDFFATDLGYLGVAASRWFYGNNDGTFTDSNAGSLAMTPFGWGTSVFDYDNDGDGDIVFHGGVDLLSILEESNPGVVLQNSGDCSGDFVWDDTTLLFDHLGRDVQGVAVGDLNHDGFEDIVTVSSYDRTVSARFQLSTLFTGGPTGSPFDPISRFEQVWAGNVNPGNMTYLADNGREVVNGSLGVEISSADNGNGWVAVNTVGSAGILDGGTVNRNGIGAVVSFTPEGGNTSKRPIIGGSSYASQDSLTANFGLGEAHKGTVDVLWPGGVRNRLYDLYSTETVTMPHIPCSFDADWNNFGQYNRCVVRSLVQYRRAGEIDTFEKLRLWLSAVIAFFDH